MSTLRPTQILVEAERHQEAHGHGGDVFLSRDAGFVPRTPPLRELPSSHAAWDQIAEMLPVLTRDMKLSKAVADLPLLEAGPEDLPNMAMARASAVLAHLAHAWVREKSERFPQLPDVLARPWHVISERLGRSQSFLSFTDVIAYNWRLRDPSGPRTIPNMDLLLPVTGSEAERISQLTMTESLALSGPIIGAVCELADGIAEDDDDKVSEALRVIRESLDILTYQTFLQMDPNPWSPTATNPLIWGKLVAPFGAPIYEGEPGFSGTAAPTFQVLDAIFGRTTYGTDIGKETLHQRQVYPSVYQRFLTACEMVPLREWVRDRAGSAVRGLYQQTLEAYVGKRGWLGIHRLKLYGYIEIAFKAGREASNGGLAANVAPRSWDVVDDQIERARCERVVGWSMPTVQVRRVSVSPTSSLDDSLCKKVVFDLTDTGLTYQAGDRVSVWIRHREALVERTRLALRSRADAPILLTARWREHVAQRGLGACNELPLSAFLAIAKLRPVPRHLVKALYRLSRSSALYALLEAREEDQFELWALFELVTRTTQYDVRRLVRAQPWEEESLAQLVLPEPSRLYSISSAPVGDAPDLLSLTVGELRYQAKASTLEAPIEVYGGASSFLVRSIDPDEPAIPLQIHRPSRFRLPERSDVPVVMFAGGTGISPMMGFLRKRLADGESAPLVLFFGVRNRGCLHYEDELRSLAEQGKLTLHVALSREDQHLVVEDGRSHFQAGDARRLPVLMLEPARRRELRSLLAEQRGVVYLCGHSDFAHAVLEALHEILGEGDEHEDEVLYRLNAEGRLMLDIFTPFKPAVSAGILGAGLYNISEVINHNLPSKSLWLIIRGQVYDVTKFAHLHPGGDNILISNAGLDATRPYEKIEHHANSEVDAMLDMYKIGAVRRLNLSVGWGVALLPEGPKVVSLHDIYRAWVRYAYRIVETENILHNERSIQSLALTSAEAPTDRTPLKLKLALEAHRRTVFVVIPELLGDELLRLWLLTVGLWARTRPLAELTGYIDAVRAAPSAQAAREHVDLLLSRLREDPSQAQELTPLCDALMDANQRMLNRLKSVISEGLAAFEKYETEALSKAGPALVDCLLRLPSLLERFHEELVTVFRESLH
ncbi:MAG: hypothetical protein H6727_17380 [Myxococcales bacterium]|nr:hypothetical protein [Myxococcales bacterium]